MAINHMKLTTVENIVNEISLFVQTEIIDQSFSFDNTLSFKDLGIDSMAKIQIILFVERKYGIKIETEDLIPKNLESISTLAVFTFNRLENGEKKYG